MNKYNKLKHDNINKTSFIFAYSQKRGKFKNFNGNIIQKFAIALLQFHQRST